MTDINVKVSQRVKFGLIGCVLGIAVGAFTTCMLFAYNPPDKQDDAELSAIAVMNEIIQINELATASQTYTVVEKVEDANRLFDLVDIPFTDKMFILAYNGEIKAGVNLDEARVEVEGDMVRVVLPAATILSDAIDTGSFRTLHEQAWIFNQINIEDVTKYLNETQRQVESEAAGGKVLAEAQANAESSVRALLGSVLPEKYNLEVSSGTQQ